MIKRAESCLTCLWMLCAAMFFVAMSYSFMYGTLAPRISAYFWSLKAGKGLPTHQNGKVGTPACFVHFCGVEHRHKVVAAAQLMLGLASFPMDRS